MLGPHDLGQHQRRDARHDRCCDIGDSEIDWPVDAHHDVGSLLRDPRHGSGSAARASALRAGRIESSRSRMMASAPRSCALARKRSESTGTNSSDRQEGFGRVISPSPVNALRPACASGPRQPPRRPQRTPPNISHRLNVERSRTRLVEYCAGCCFMATPRRSHGRRAAKLQPNPLAPCKMSRIHITRRYTDEEGFVRCRRPGCPTLDGSRTGIRTVTWLLHRRRRRRGVVPEQHDSVGGSFSSTTGFLADIVAGYDFVGPRVELEVGFGFIPFTANLAGTAARSNFSGDAHQLHVMGKVLYDFIPASTITPYIGAGAGIAFVDGNAFCRTRCSPTRASSASATTSTASGASPSKAATSAPRMPTSSSTA